MMLFFGWDDDGITYSANEWTGNNMSSSWPRQSRATLLIVPESDCTAVQLMLEEEDTNNEVLEAVAGSCF